MKPVNFAIFGSGTMADIYARLITQREDCRLQAIVGNSAEKTHQLSNAFGATPFVNGDYAGMFKQMREVDAVIIATPEWVREKPLREAIGNNVNILLEKPFADSWAEAKILNSILKNYSHTVAMCHVLRFSPRFLAMKRAVDKGEIGEVRHIYCRRNSNNKRVARVLGKTNLAFWLTPHDIDMIQWVVPSKIKKVFVSTRDKARTNDDYLIANLQFENGVTAVLEISWCGPSVSGTSREAVFEVRGNAGNLEVADFDMNVKIFKENARVLVEDTYEDYLLKDQHRGYFFELIDDFVRKIKANYKHSEELNHAVETTRICEMIRISIDEERVVKSDEVS